MKKFAAPLFFVFITVLLAATTNYEKHDVRFKTILDSEKEGVYQATLLIKNKQQLDNFAKLSIDLPANSKLISIDNQHEMLRDQYKDGKLNLVWMHFAKDAQYQLKFKFKSELAIEDINLKYTFWGINQGEKVNFTWTKDWKIVN